MPRPAKVDLSLRGGGWLSNPMALPEGNLSRRLPEPTTGSGSDLGFRLSRSTGALERLTNALGEVSRVVPGAED